MPPSELVYSSKTWTSSEISSRRPDHGLPKGRPDRSGQCHWPVQCTPNLPALALPPTALEEESDDHDDGGDAVLRQGATGRGWDSPWPTTTCDFRRYTRQKPNDDPRMMVVEVQGLF